MRQGMRLETWAWKAEWNLPISHGLMVLYSIREAFNKQMTELNFEPYDIGQILYVHRIK